MPMRLSDIFKFRLARFADAAGGRLVRPDGALVNVTYVIPFNDMAPSILAAFVAGTTASQSGNTVTVVAPGHNIVGNSTRNGYRIYYPGSPSIPAGWYSGFAWIDANTITFSRSQSATVLSESVFGGQPYLSNTTIASLTLPGGALGPKGRVVVPFQRSGDVTTNVKNVRIILGGSVLSAHAITSASTGEMRLSFRNVDSESVQAGQSVADGGVTGSPPNFGAVDTAQPQNLALAAMLFAAGTWLSITTAEAEITKL